MPNNSTAAHDMFRPFLSRYSACPFLVGETEFSPEKTLKTKRGGKRRKKKREMVKEGEKETTDYKVWRGYIHFIQLESHVAEVDA